MSLNDNDENALQWFNIVHDHEPSSTTNVTLPEEGSCDISDLEHARATENHNIANLSRPIAIVRKVKPQEVFESAPTVPKKVIVPVTSSISSAKLAHTSLTGQRNIKKSKTTRESNNDVRIIDGNNSTVAGTKKSTPVKKRIAEGVRTASSNMKSRNNDGSESSADLSDILKLHNKKFRNTQYEPPRLL
jgi:hypothetical protein